VFNRSGGRKTALQGRSPDRDLKNESTNAVGAFRNDWRSLAVKDRCPGTSPQTGAQAWALFAVRMDEKFCPVDGNVSRLEDSKSHDLYSAEAETGGSPAKNFPAPGLRRFLRHTLDSLFCKSYPDKITLGELQGAQWTIRVGSLNCDSVVYSGGVGGDISFEVALDTIKKNSQAPEMRRIEFMPVGLASESKRLLFEPSNVPGEWQLAVAEKPGTRSITCTTIAGEMAKRGHTKIDLLKLDIEGFEYQVLNDCLNRSLDIGQICVEFHDFLPGIAHKTTIDAILALRKHHSRMVHKQRHDFTFLRS
jgi:FkbM family methyltransferase